MFFLFILLVLILIITIKIKIKFEDFKFDSQNKKTLEKNYRVKIIIYTFNFIPIFKLKITNKKIQKALSNKKIRQVIEKQKMDIIENKKDIDLKALKEIRNVKLEISEINLNILLGTEDAAKTAFIIPVISTFIALFLSQKVKRYNDKQVFSVNPIYTNQNLLSIEFSGIFQIKLVHIINTICTLNKKKKGDKYERTSNRRSYDYGYEQY